MGHPALIAAHGRGWKACAPTAYLCRAGALHFVQGDTFKNKGRIRNNSKNKGEVNDPTSANGGRCGAPATTPL
jgi:hypothetical protein